MGGLKSEKMQTVPHENHFFEKVAFLVFEALVRKWVPKWSPKGIQKVTKKWSTKSSKMVQKMVDEIIKFGSQHDQKIALTETRGPYKNSVWQDVPKMASRLPKIASNSLR